MQPPDQSRGDPIHQTAYGVGGVAVRPALRQAARGQEGLPRIVQVHIVDQELQEAYQRLVVLCQQAAGEHESVTPPAQPRGPAQRRGDVIQQFVAVGPLADGASAAIGLQVAMCEAHGIGADRSQQLAAQQRVVQPLEAILAVAAHAPGDGKGLVQRQRLHLLRLHRPGQRVERRPHIRVDAVARDLLTACDTLGLLHCRSDRFVQQMLQHPAARADLLAGGRSLDQRNHKARGGGQIVQIMLFHNRAKAAAHGLGGQAGQVVADLPALQALQQQDLELETGEGIRIEGGELGDQDVLMPRVLPHQPADLAISRCALPVRPGFRCCRRGSAA